MEKLTIQEEEVMRLIWRVSKGFIKDYLEQCPEPKPPYTTLASVVKNLERKAYISSRKYGNVYEYTPLIAESDYTKRFMSGFVKDYFKNSYRDLVAFFIRERKISSDELKQLIEMIEPEKNDEL
ncbi:MAG: BlaI/MecI/CopY family transcriptional regulator [Prevotellaceae bacterium]|jgi:predicted transcriptional regulator|nr:BlaI/MecI/CopY family transcriptional regulator [Prevotellaceae bacterium]